jgi:signal transduction histidine kinase
MAGSEHRPRARRVLSRADNPLVRAVGRVPATVHRKLLVAFVGSVVLLVILGVLGLRVLSESNDRVDTLGSLQQRQAAYASLQADTGLVRTLLALRPTGEINAYLGGNPAPPPSTGSLSLSDQAIVSTLNDLGPLTDVTKLGFTPTAEEMGILAQMPPEYRQLSGVMPQILAADQAGNAIESQKLQAENAEPAARNLVALAQQLVGTTRTETTSLIDQNRTAYLDSEHLFIGVAAGSIVLALLLGYILSWSLVGPIRRMDTRLAAITSGDFSGHVDVPNRDELGALAANLNRMNDELGRVYGELEAASRHKSEFLANMSHELRTPLNAIIGFSEVLQDRLFGDINEKQAEYLTDIHGSGRHLLSLINDILDLSKIEAGRMELQVSSFSLSEVLENSMALTRERATRQGISLKLEVDPSIGVIEADERKLKQVLFNLLTNAVKFTPTGGHIDVGARGDGDGVLVSVRDDGVGIAPEDQVRIFEEFQQAGTSHLQEGTGLGLALSRRFIELHGGGLTVESVPGQGSTFTFNLPRARGIGAAGSDDARASTSEDAPVRAASTVT